MNKHQFLETMRRERTAWEALLTEVGEARMTLPGAAGHWSVKDLVAHITAYERWLVALFAAVRHGDAQRRTVPEQLQRLFWQ